MGVRRILTPGAHRVFYARNMEAVSVHCIARSRLLENDEFTQQKAPDALHGHGDEFARHFRAADHGGGPSDKPGAEQEIPHIERHEHGHAAPKIAGRPERDVAVHEKVERPRVCHGDAVCHAGG